MPIYIWQFSALACLYFILLSAAVVLHLKMVFKLNIFGLLSLGRLQKHYFGRRRASLCQILKVSLSLFSTPFLFLIFLMVVQGMNRMLNRQLLGRKFRKLESDRMCLDRQRQAVLQVNNRKSTSMVTISFINVKYIFCQFLWLQLCNYPQYIPFSNSKQMVVCTPCIPQT